VSIYTPVVSLFGSTQNIINTTIGHSDFDVSNEIKEQAKLYIERGYNTYTETKVILPLRKVISDH